jgi:hypothetical protein
MERPGKKRTEYRCQERPIHRTAALIRLLAREIDFAMELLRGFCDRMISLREADHPAFVAHDQAAAPKPALPS